MSTPRAVAIYRDRSYSPHQHLSNDRAILDAASSELRTLGWQVDAIEERSVANRRFPAAECYLNMAQGEAASTVLAPLEYQGRRFFNRPTSVLRCHRHRLVAAMLACGIPFPDTVQVRTDGPLPWGALDRFGPREQVWLKRGGVHAEQESDVRSMPLARIPEGLADFAARGIRTAVVQRHLDGPVVKFYGVGGSALFVAYVAGTKAPVTPALADPDLLRILAVRAAARLRLDIYGGDFVIGPGGQPTLIDFNDWPSFAPIRAEAARAIAGYVRRQVRERVAP
jgi:hypothetical protein